MEAAEQDEDVMVTVAERPGAKESRRHQPRYSVIIENDDDHSFDYVILVLQKVCGHNLQNAFRLTREAHELGRSVVWSGAREVAELKCEQIRGFGPDPFAPRPVTYPLGCTIEAMPE